MKKLCLLCIFLIGIVAHAQRNMPLPEGDWYVITGSMEAKLSIDDKYLILNPIPRTDDGYKRPADTIKIVKQGKAGLILMEKDGEREMALFRVQMLDNGNSVSLSEVETSESKETLLDIMENTPEPTDRELFDTNFIFSKSVYDSFKSNKGYDKMTAEDLKTALIARNSRSKRMQDYLDANPDADIQEYKIRRMTQDVLEKTFLVLGYNPYLEVEYNFRETFADKEEIINLLEQQ